TVSLNAAGEFNIFAERTIDAVVDVGGYYAPPGGGLFSRPLPRPVGLLCSRTNQGNCDKGGVPLKAGTSLTVPGRVTCESLAISANPQALTGNITVIHPNAHAGYLGLYTISLFVPPAATMFYLSPYTTLFPSTVSLNAAGEFNIFAERTIDAVVDVGGY